MPVAHTIFDEIIIGSPLHISRSVRIGTQYGQLEKCWLTVKEQYTQPDAEAVIKKSITTSVSTNGQITNAGATGTAEFTFNLVSIDTEKLQSGKTYVIDIWIKLQNDEPSGIETGLIRPHAAVTRQRT